MGKMINNRPMDSFWVENLNSAFDENRVLCLSNGQRIKIA
jgi:hypothetical protein